MVDIFWNIIIVYKSGKILLVLLQTRRFSILGVNMIIQIIMINKFKEMLDTFDNVLPTTNKIVF